MSADKRWSRQTVRMPLLIVIGVFGLLVANGGDLFFDWLRGLGLLVWFVCFFWQAIIDIGNWWAKRKSSTT
jgi:hypothetical protein